MDDFLFTVASTLNLVVALSVIYGVILLIRYVKNNQSKQSQLNELNKKVDKILEHIERNNKS